MKTLDKVTLIAVSSVKINETIDSLKKCSSKIDFHTVKLLSHEKPDDLPDDIVFEHCPYMGSIKEYSNYIFRYLYRHIRTSHCLLVQHDSWILNPELWDDMWLNYDYIGAPWPYSDTSYVTDKGVHVRVGNGGFSLRSMYLMATPMVNDIPSSQRQGYWNEDGQIAVYNRDQMIEIGVSYAPIEVASVFSYENTVPENVNVKPFGFHKNLPPWEYML